MQEDNNFTSEQEEALRAYKDALWVFIIDHCDILDNGAFFVKFHSSGRKDFERRVNARLKYHYHRNDTKEKEKVHKERRDKFEDKRKNKAQRQEAYERRRRLLRTIGDINSGNRFLRLWGRFMLWIYDRFIHR